jgi:hypothetical protein
MGLNLKPNLTAPDDIYEALIKTHEGLSREQSEALNARLILETKETEVSALVSAFAALLALPSLQVEIEPGLEALRTVLAGGA